MAWVSYDVKEQISIRKFFSFFEIHYENGYNFPGETHNFWECLYVIEGSLCVSGDERIYTLTKGEIIFHKPLELHKFYVDNPDGATLLIFSFSMEGRLSDHLKNKVYRLSVEQEQIVSSLLSYVRKKQQEFRIPEDVSPYQRYLTPFETIPTYSQTLTTYICQLFLFLIDNGSLSKISNTWDSRIFSQAVSYMNSHICRHLSVAEISSFCNISEASLKRVFHKYAGISVHKYFLTLKIKIAVELLESGKTVTETADQLGFAGQAYFSTVFKRETGISPSRIKTEWAWKRPWESKEELDRS